MRGWDNPFWDIEESASPLPSEPHSDLTSRSARDLIILDGGANSAAKTSHPAWFVPPPAWLVQSQRTLFKHFERRRTRER